MKKNFDFINTIRNNPLIVKNLSYLSFLEIVNVLVPLITLPYLIRILGADTYGLIIFVQAAMYYLSLFQNFGLNTLAIKEVSVHRDSHKILSSIVNEVLLLKAILFVLLLSLLALTIQLVTAFKTYELLLYLSMWVCLFDFIFPRWYFQGIEQMKYITLLTVLGKIISLILIFSLVRTANDYLLVPLIYGIGSLITGLGSLLIVYRYHGIKFSLPKFSKAAQLLKKASTFLISDISVSVFAKSNRLLIGSFLGMAEVAYYDLAEKIVFTFKNIPLNIVRDTIYPRIARTKNLKPLRNISIIMGGYSVVVIVLLFLLAPSIIAILGGQAMQDSVNVLRLFSLSIFTTHISNYYITVGLWSLGYEKAFRNLMINATLLFLGQFALLWITKNITIYTVTTLPIFVDLYLIVHTYIIYKQKRLLKQ